MVKKTVLVTGGAGFIGKHTANNLIQEGFEPIIVDRKEKTEYVCPDNKNETKIEELEKIYNSKNELVYKSNLQKEISYDSLESSIVYKNDSYWSNYFDLEQNWYIKNGSIIRYNLSKHYLHNQSNYSLDFLQILYMPFRRSP